MVFAHPPRDLALTERLDALVISATAQRLKLHPSVIGPSSSFFDDLGADSLSVVEIVMALEEKLGVTVPDGDLDQFNTVGELCDYLSRQVGTTPPGAG